MARLAAHAQRAALAAFGQPARLTIDGQAFDLRAIFVAAHELVEIMGDAPVSTTRPVLSVLASSLPVQPAEGDEAEVAGRRYRIVDVRPDGLGMVKLILQEV
ncbi:MAG: hypothetical protein N2690_00915 [Rhodocyclaceae bacterium]|nr:hypothetical protein [Rhodocyclaceae bacterium]